MALLTVLCLVASASGAGPCRAAENGCCQDVQVACDGHACLDDDMPKDRDTDEAPACPKQVCCLGIPPALPLNTTLILEPRMIESRMSPRAIQHPPDPAPREILHVPRMDRAFA